MSEHSKLSPSSSTRWINCPGSLHCPSDIPSDEIEDDGKVTLEGTHAHALAEYCLKNLTSPFKINHVDEEMAMHVASYLVFTLSRASKYQRWVEGRVYYNEDVWGTSDFIIWNADYETLEVIDLKYGYRIVPATSSQLNIYAISAIRTFDLKPKRVIQSVFQPRQSHVSIYDYPVSVLDKWVDETLEPALDRIAAGDETTKAGDHCRYCKAKSICKSYQHWKGTVYDLAA